MNTDLARVIVAIVILAMVIGVPVAIRIWDRRTGGLRETGWDSPAPAPSAPAATKVTAARPGRQRAEPPG